MLINPSFENGWADLPPAPGWLVNQQPAGWTLSWVEPGESLFGAGDTASGVPECVHKLIDQLPEHERPGGSDPLILDGEAVYKVFHHAAAFGAELRQRVSGLEPGSSAVIQVPVRVHLHEDTDPWAAEAGVWLNDDGFWQRAERLGDRVWNTLQVATTVPENGIVDVVLRFKSKWDRPKDFFIDNVQFVGVPAESEPPPPPPPAAELPGGARVDFKRTYILFHRDAPKSWVTETRAQTWAAGHRVTVGGGADDAGLGNFLAEDGAVKPLSYRRVIAVDPAAWGDEAHGDGDGLAGFLEAYYPGTEYHEVTPASAADCAAKVLAVLEGEPGANGGNGQSPPFRFTHWPTEYRRVTQLFGANPQNYERFGLPGHDGTDIRAYRGSKIFAVAAGVVSQVHASAADGHNYGIFVRVRHVDGYETTYAHLQEVKVIEGMPVAGGDLLGLADNTGNSFGDHLHLTLKRHGYTYVDANGTPWPYNIHNSDDFLRPLAPEAYPDFTPSTVALGGHDEAFADWMVAGGLTGWGLHMVALGQNPTQLHFSAHERAGVKVVVRLNHGYGRTGTLPHPDDRARQDAFVQACVQTIESSAGVWGWQLFNEPNNPNEWPSGMPLTPEYVAEMYGRIWNRSPAEARIAPPPVDPYFGPASNDYVANNLEYWQRMLDGIPGAEFFVVHSKTQQPDPDLVDSDAKFSDWPLQWQYLHFRAYETHLAAVPANWQHLPVLQTEMNPHPAWDEATAVEWVRRARANLQAFNSRGGMQFLGGLVYRWSGDGWGLQGKTAVLDGLKELMRA